MQLQSFSARHKCQIDCTNHDEVINALQSKSKDLYYFWRNYEWLYNRYYSQVNEPKPAPTPTVVHKENHDNCQKEIESLQNQNDRLIKQNKRLKLQLESIKRSHSEDNSDKFEIEFKKQISMWKSKANEYQQINEKLVNQNGKLKIAMREKEDQFDEEIQKMKRELKKSNNINIQLQQTIDQLRKKVNIQVPSVSPPPPPHPNRYEGPSSQEIEEFSRKQTITVSSRLKTIQAQAQRIVISECDLLKQEMEQRLAEMISELSQRQLQSVIVAIEQ